MRPNNIDNSDVYGAVVLIIANARVHLTNCYVMLLSTMAAADPQTKTADLGRP